MNYSKCKCKNKHVIEIEYSVGNLENQIVRLCKECNEKPVYQKHRISEKAIGRK